MNRIDKRFQEIKKEGRGGFIAYVTGGDPSPDMSLKIILALEKAGADIVEIGIPFSDPLADGPIIQSAVMRALNAGMTVKKLLHLVKEVRKRSGVSIVLFTYFNPILKYGLNKFATDAASAGADGVLVLDLPPEESVEYKKIMSAARLKTVYLVAPTSTDDRMKKISRFCDGFIYCVSRTGVTGLAKSSFDELSGLVKRVRKHTKLPIAVGFGVSEHSQVSKINKIADAVVVGSAIVKIIQDHPKDPVSKIHNYVKGLVG